VRAISIVRGSRMARLVVMHLLCAAGCGGSTTAVESKCSVPLDPSCASGAGGNGGAGAGAGGSEAHGGNSSSGGGTGTNGGAGASATGGAGGGAGASEIDGSMPIEGGCIINSDCNAPLVCAFKRCHEACETSRDCPNGVGCVFATDTDTGSVFGAVCQLPDEAPCRLNKDCKGNEICTAGQCRDQCQENRNCVRNQVCVEGSCADPSELPTVDGGNPDAGR
jgi:hypothetical protein